MFKNKSINECKGKSTLLISIVTALVFLVGCKSEILIEINQLRISKGAQSKLPYYLRDVTHQSSEYVQSPSISFKGNIFFIGHEKSTGNEIWISQMSGEGSKIFKDIYPGAGPSKILKFYDAGDLFFFWADDGKNGKELWRSDGTLTGTYLLHDFDKTSSRIFSTESNKTDFIKIGDTYYFSADTPEHGLELWQTNGKDQTSLVEDLEVGSASSEPSFFVEFNSKLYLSAETSALGRELYVVDNDSLVLVQDINTGSANGVSGNIFVLNNQMIFNGPGGLWRSEGTALTTENFASIGGYLEASDGSYVYFSADSGDGYELHRSDGTSLGTTQVNDDFPGAGSSYPRDITIIEGVPGLFYRISDDENGLSTNRRLVHRLGGVRTLIFDPDLEGYLSDRLRIYPSKNGILFSFNEYTSATFFAEYDDVTEDFQLYEYAAKPIISTYETIIYGLADGNIDYIIFDTGLRGSLSDRPYVQNTNIDDIKVFNDFVTYRSGNTDIFAYDVFSKTQEQYNLSGNVTNSGTYRPMSTDNYIYFETGNFYAGDGYELWRSGGTLGSTEQLYDLNPGNPGSSPRVYKSISNQVVFSANDGSSQKMYCYDEDLDALNLIEGGSSFFIHTWMKFIAYGGGYIAYMGDSLSTYDLWYFNCDGSIVVQILDEKTNGNSQVDHFTYDAGQDLVYFTALDNNGDRYLYKTNGTAVGTSKLLPEINNVIDLFVDGTKLYICSDSLYVKELSDSTNKTQAFDFSSVGLSGCDSFKGKLPSGRLIFTGSSSLGGTEVFSYDPASGQGAQVTSRFASDAAGGYGVRNVTILGDKIVYTINQGAFEDELWVIYDNESYSQLYLDKMTYWLFDQSNILGDELFMQGRNYYGSMKVYKINYRDLPTGV